MFTGGEVLGFDGFLGGGDALGDEAGIDRHVLFHAEAEHEVLHAFAAEDAEEIVLEGEEETGGAGVALAAGTATELVIDTAGFVAFGADDAEASDGDDFLTVGIAVGFVTRVHLVPGFERDTIVHVGTLEVVETIVGDETGFMFVDGFGDRLFDGLFLGEEIGVAAKENVGTAAGHVGGDGNAGVAAGLSDDVGFAFVILGVQHFVLDAHFSENRGELFALGDRDGADQDRLALGVAVFDFAGGVAELFFFGAVDDVVGVFPFGDAVGRNGGDVELVGFAEFGGFRVGRTGHAGQLFVHTEVVLEGDRREGLVFALDFDVFLGFDGLMETVGPAAAGHEAAGEFVDDDDFEFTFFAGADDVFLVPGVHHVGFESLLDVMVEFDVLGFVEVAEAEEALDLHNALFGEGDGAVFFVDGVVPGEVLFAGFFAFDDFAANEARDDLIDAVVLVCRLFGGAGDYERGAGFVDQDRIDFVDDGEEVAALDAIFQAELHVVAEVVEAELVVGAVGDVGLVGGAAIAIADVVGDAADGEAEELVNSAHPLGVALGEVVVNGNDVGAFAGERVQIDGERGDKGFAFTGFHFGDAALVELHAADQLDVVMAHRKDAAAGFANGSEGFDEEIVEGGAVVQLVLEFGGFGGELGVGERFVVGLASVDGFFERLEGLDIPVRFGAEDFREYVWKHRQWAQGASYQFSVGGRGSSCLMCEEGGGLRVYGKSGDGIYCGGDGVEAGEDPIVVPHFGRFGD